MPGPPRPLALLVVLLGAPLAAFAKPGPPAAGVGAAGWSLGEAMIAAKALATSVGMPAPRQDLVMPRLEKALGDPSLRGKYGPVSGLLAYQSGEGGFLIKGRRGRGLLRLQGSAGDRPIELSSVSFGAQIGGSSEWGVGIVFALRDPALFGGEHSGSVTSATAGAASVNVTVVKPRGGRGYTVYLIAAGAGLSASAAATNLTIRFRP